MFSMKTCDHCPIHHCFAGIADPVFFPVQGAEADKGGACEDRIVLRDWGDFYNLYHNIQYHC